MDEQEIYQKIEDYAHGKLSVNEIEDLWVHILEKPELLHYVETIAHLKHISSTENTVNNPVNVPARYSVVRKTFLAVAACVVIAIGILYYFHISTENIMPKAQALIPSSDFESVDVYRSVDNTLNPQEQELNRGYAMMVRKQDDQAKKIFQDLLSKNPGHLTQAKLYFNLGAIAYNHNHYDEALTNFQHALSNSTGTDNQWLSEKINWYLGQTHLQLKQQKKTIDYVKQVMGYDGYYHDRAESLLNSLRQE